MNVVAGWKIKNSFMAVENLTGLEKPLQKLVETVSEGVGVVGNHLFKFDVAKIKRIGEAEAEIEKGKIIAQAEAQEKAVEILSRAEIRFALEQYNKQINLENILVKSREDLSKKEVTDEAVDKDWTMRFLDIAQNVSRDEMQDVLAKILSGEIQKPGSYSYQTLEVVKYLSQRDLERFLKFVALSTELGVIKLHGGSSESLQKYGLNFGDYLDLSSIGLFNQSSMLSYNIEMKPEGKHPINIGGEWFILQNEDKENIKIFNLGLFVFSNVGREIRSLLLERAENEHAGIYKTDFIEETEKKSIKVTKAIFKTKEV